MSGSHACPECNVSLSSARYAGTEFEVCPQCLGHWFDYLRLKQVQDEAGRDLALLDSGTPTRPLTPPTTLMACPGCSNPLEAFRYPLGEGIQPEVCHRCGGVWVRHGDLIAMTTATEQARSEALRNGSRLTGEQFVTFPSDVASHLDTHPGVRYDVPPIDLDHPLLGAPDSLKHATTEADISAVAAIAAMQGEVARSQDVSRQVGEIARVLNQPAGISSLPWLFSGWHNIRF